MNKNGDNNKYPKTLIIGGPFNDKTGGGITMSNLFRGWPKERLAIASNANLLIEADSSICDIYFQLGYNSKLHPFPLNIVLPKVYCGPIKLSLSNNSGAKKTGHNPGKYKKIYSVLKNILEFLGLFNLLYRMKVTVEFNEWIEVFAPDIIYTQLGSLESIQFVSDVAILTGKPVALHIMDDWPNTITKSGLLYYYRKGKLHKEFSGLVNRSTVLMSIGESMSEEYKKRYNRDFIPFHNPIEINNWLPFSRNEWSFDDRFTILYAGRIGPGMKNSVIDIARVVNHLVLEHEDLFFEIQTPDISELDGKVRFNEHVSWVEPLDYLSLPKKFAKVDLLVLPIDFDKESIKFLQYSFQTKISEYMISGTPVLVYSPAVTATATYAQKEGWAYVVTERSDLLLKNAILDLYSKPDLRKGLGEKAKQLAITHEDSNLVREKFRECLANNLE